MQRIDAHAQHVQHRVERKNPLVVLRDDAQRAFPLPDEKKGTSQQHDIFGQSLSVGQNQCIAKASTIGDGVVKVDVDRHQRHEYHKEERPDACKALTYPQKEVDSKAELHKRQEDGSDIQIERAGHDGNPPCGTIGFQFVLHPHRVKRFGKAGKEKCGGEQPLRHPCEQAQSKVDKTILRHDCLVL